jgi:hypothetical protein
MDSLDSGLYGQSFSALCPSSADDQSAPSGGHSHEKTMRSFSLRIAEICQILFHVLNPG